MSSWFYGVKKYIWHEEKTPFHLSPSKMNKKQAHNELFIFASFEGVIALMLVYGILNHFNKTGDSSYIPAIVYCLMLLGTLYFLIKHKPFWAGCFCLTPPLVVLGLLFFLGFHPNNGSFEKMLLGAFLAFWFFYSVRIFDICRNFSKLPESQLPPIMESLKN
jgi:hypothetical protein